MVDIHLINSSIINYIKTVAANLKQIAEKNCNPTLQVVGGGRMGWGGGGGKGDWTSFPTAGEF